MRYTVRAIKYFFYYILLLAIIIAILRLLNMTEGGVEQMFRNGWNSVWMILGMFALVAAIYPYFGFKKHGVIIPGEYGEIRDTVVNFMKDRGYVLETEEGENMTFRLRSGLNRATRMWEDRITFERDFHGFLIEGPNRDVVRLKSGLEYKFRKEEI